MYARRRSPEHFLNYRDLGLGDRILSLPGSYEHSNPVDRDENV